MNSGFGSFGATPSNNNNTGFGFGSTPATTNAASTNSFSFGNTNNQQPAASGTGLFGGMNQTTTGTGGLFGTNQQQSNQQPSTGLFGNTQQSTGAFGSTQPATGLFGNTQSSTGAFGTTQQSTGAFGNAFGNNNQQSTGLFGGQSSGTGLFGNTQVASTQQQQTPSLFGGAMTQPQSTTLFGGVTNANTNPTTSLFGASNTSSFQFGGAASTTAPATSSLFTGGMFGANNQKGLNFPATTSAATSNSLFQRPMISTNVTTSNPAQPANIPLSIIESLFESFMTTSPKCAFKHVFYNIVHPSEVGLYARPPGMDDALWNQAIQNNPDPNCMVPVLAIGFQDLSKRIQQQQSFQAAQEAKMSEISDRVASMEHNFDCKTSIKFQSCQRRSLELQAQLKKIVHSLERIRLSGSGGPMPTEERLRQGLWEISRNLKSSKAVQRIEELRYLLENKKMKEADQFTSFSTGSNGIDDSTLKSIAKILTEHQAGISCLKSILEEDSKLIQ